MAKLDEFAFMDATAQAELVHQRQVKPIELLDAAIERIERLNPSINAVITPMYAQARAAASGHIPEGPFTGVPFLVKDLWPSYAGVRLAKGSAFLRDYIADHDCELVIRLKRAGLITLGKTNTPEFGLLPTTEPRLFGPTRNPWGLERTVGGSSGGSAAAVAAGMVAMANASDGGGSIRIPSSCCGVFGLKPTRGRNPLGPDYGELMGGLSAEHAVTRSVRDSAALLDATSGPDVGDPYWAPPPKRPFLKVLKAKTRRLRIAFAVAAPIQIPVHPDCVAAVREAAALCADLGHHVDEASPTVDGELMVRAFTTVLSVGCASCVDGWAHITQRKPVPDQFEPLTWAVAELGRQQSGPAYLLARQDLFRLSRDIARFFAGYDVWLTPTITEPPALLGSFDSPLDNPLHGLLRAAAIVPFTAPFNATGQPAMSVPLHWNADGLPVGVQFAGRFGDEATLFRLAAQLEEARPWANRRPRVSA